ncbi:uncharacterized protein J3D65DRAFT_39324 [Phyllosticta citribraziliensis]|uniref:Uncharacterized protein n=1 Tax=Phyllosticta citribraziliensis TaxID=989973 RepID=A0ABR1MC41_9PEZI
MHLIRKPGGGSKFTCRKPLNLGQRVERDFHGCLTRSKQRAFAQGPGRAFQTHNPAAQRERGLGAHTLAHRRRGTGKREIPFTAEALTESNRASYRDEVGRISVCVPIFPIGRLLRKRRSVRCSSSGLLTFPSSQVANAFGRFPCIRKGWSWSRSTCPAKACHSLCGKVPESRVTFFDEKCPHCFLCEQYLDDLHLDQIKHLDGLIHHPQNSVLSSVFGLFGSLASPELSLLKYPSGSGSLRRQRFCLSTNS